MAARSIGSLTVSFGLVAIPVKLYTATQSANAISFNLLHKTCGSRLKQQYICQKEGVVVERDDMVKGYEFAKDQYVRFAPEEIKALEEVGTHSVEISEFVPIESIDPVYYDKTYYLAPDKGAAKPYALLTEALRQAGRCGVGRWAARGKGYIVILRPIGDVLAMQQLHYSTDVRRASEVEVPKPEVKPAELKLAQQLIDQQTAEKFDAEAYKDEVRGRIEAAVEKKVEGKEISVAETAPAGEGKVIDLMEALRASLQKSESARSHIDRLGPQGTQARRGAGEADAQGGQAQRLRCAPTACATWSGC
jgi:DNA end-binding protein Ku